MGKLTDDQFDKIFREKLIGFEKSPNNGLWLNISKSIAKNNFLKFGWNHSNIFFTIATSVIFISSITYFISQRQQNKEIKPIINKEKIIINTDTILKQSKKINEDNLSNKKINKIKVNDNSTLPIIKNKFNKVISEDSSAIIRTYSIDNVEKKEPQVENKQIQKKIITLIKRDTIRVTDTVTVKKFRRIK